MNRRTYIRSLVKKLLTEDEEKNPLKKENDSLDKQVDRFLRQYEKNAAGKDPSSFKLEEFVDSVVQLIDNYENLLELRNTIVRRSLNLLNQKDKTLSALAEDMFRDAHAISLEQTRKERTADETQPPAADRAGPGGI